MQRFPAYKTQGILSKNEWCPDSELNQGHGDFQSPALPTELSGQIFIHIKLNGRGGRIWTRGPLVPNQLRYQTALHPDNFYGGEDGIRTHAALANPNDLANRPLQPLEYFSQYSIVFPTFNNSRSWRRGWDSNPRPLSESLVFKTSSLNHSDTSPRK